MAKLWRTMRARPWITALLVIVLVGGVGGGVWWFTQRNKTAAAAAPTSTTQLVTVSTGTIAKSISTTGTVTPAVQDDVNFAASGKVTSVKVAVGDKVKKGQPLGTINTVDLKAALASANAALANINAKVAADQTAVTTAAGTTSTTDDSTAVAQLAADTASVATAKSQVTAAQQALAAATLTSPIDGVVATVSVAVGDQVSAGNSSGSSAGTGTGSSGSGTSTRAASANSNSSSSSSSSSSAQFLVVGTTSWVTDVTVDDSSIDLIKKGIQARLTVDSSTTPLFGKVTSVGLISTSTGDTASYPVVVSITGSPTGLHDGASATVELIYEQLTNVLVVPTLALHTENSGRVVYQMVNGKQVSTPVTVGESSGTTTEIKSGLAEGDQVLVTVTRAAGGTGTGRSTGGRTTTGRGGFGGTGAGGFGGTGAGGFGGTGAGGFGGTGAGGAGTGAGAGGPGAAPGGN